MIVSGDFEFEIDIKMSVSLSQIENLHIIDASDTDRMVDDIGKIKSGFETDLLENSHMIKYIKGVCNGEYVKIFVRSEWSCFYQCYNFDYGIEDVETNAATNN